MKEKEFKVPVFKNTRHNIIEAVYGSLSEDAAAIASEEHMKSRLKFINELEKNVNDKNSASGSDSGLLEAICNHVTTTEDLIVMCFWLGKKMTEFNNPSARIAMMMKKKY